MMQGSEDQRAALMVARWFALLEMAGGDTQPKDFKEAADSYGKAYARLSNSDQGAVAAMLTESLKDPLPLRS